MACIVCEPHLTKKAISGGSSETEVRLPTVIPTGAPAALVETIATEVGTRPRTRRKSRGSTAVGGGVVGAGPASKAPRLRGAMQVVQRGHPSETCADSPSRLSTLGLTRPDAPALEQPHQMASSLLGCQPKSRTALHRDSLHVQTRGLACSTARSTAPAR